MSTALGVAPDSSGQGCDALTHRRTIAAQWENTGIVTGLEVSGRQDLRYGVTPGVAVCSMGEADGMSMAWWDGAGSPCTENQVQAGDSAYARIDAVYIISHTGAPDNQVHVKVAQGQPSASPVAPQVEAGGLVLAYMRLPAGATSTAAAVQQGDVDYALPVGSTLGVLAQVWDRSTALGPGKGSDGDYSYELSVSFYLPTDRQVQFRYDDNFSAQDGRDAQVGMVFQVDGANLAGSATNLIAKDSDWTPHTHTYISTVPRGLHAARIKKWWQSGSAPSYHYGSNRHGQETFAGRRFQVIDLGVAR